MMIEREADDRPQLATEEAEKGASIFTSSHKMVLVEVSGPCSPR